MPLVFHRGSGEKVRLRVGQVEVEIMATVVRGRIVLSFDAPPEAIIWRDELGTYAEFVAHRRAAAEARR